MRLRPALLAIAAVLLAFASLAQAGYRYLIPVEINDSSRYAFGSLDGALRSPDGVQCIGRNRNAFSIYCYAMNSAGVLRTCSTSDPNMVAVVRAMSNKAYLIFYWDTAGNCAAVSTSEMSYTQN